MTPTVDAAEFLARLIQCPSVTPADAGALSVVESTVTALGFKCQRLAFSDSNSPTIDNLFARYDSPSVGGSPDSPPCLGFAGHTDVVPIGVEAQWSHPPFGGVIADGRIWGRGAADMKGGIAAFVAAAARVIKELSDKTPFSLVLIITGDEEGPAINGTVKMLDWMVEQNQIPDFCLVGEPTNPQILGQMMKVGRRGSMNGVLRVSGIQGHVAYPDRADNPLPKMLRLLAALGSGAMDHGSQFFQPSNLEITSIDTGNAAANVIPAESVARFNIRFNDLHTSASLDRDLRAKLDECEIPYELKWQVSGESFITREGKWSRLVAESVKAVTGLTPEASTSGGTSDARFIANHCPVVEFGLVGASMHKVDENVRLVDLAQLTDIYAHLIREFVFTRS
ncbi:MAG: succinyl-diaminopimelate desuccinylase [Candidatus Pacebacteria bacterium]|nr:succinyl-diaminopimelate desuccinylase [Candidatus Paceibacterota bacterium]